LEPPSFVDSYSYSEIDEPVAATIVGAAGLYGTPAARA
jgi:hypothetical protein